MKLKEDPDTESDDIETNLEQTSPQPSPEEVKNLLINRLNNYKYNKKNYTINATAVKRFTIKANEAYCSVQCPFCEVKIPCIYVSRWNTGNFEKHVLSHINKTLDKTSSTENTEKTTIRAKRNVLSQVDKIFG